MKPDGDLVPHPAADRETGRSNRIFTTLLGDHRVRSGLAVLEVLRVFDLAVELADPAVVIEVATSQESSAAVEDVTL